MNSKINYPQTINHIFKNASLLKSRACAFVTMTCLFGVASVSGQTLRFQFAFEDSGNTSVDSVAGVTLNMVTNNGTAADLHGAPGSGVAGNGKALDMRSSVYSAGELASAVGFPTTIGAVPSFTLSCWIKPVSSQTNATFGRFVLGKTFAARQKDGLRRSGTRLLGRSL
jgi:hypothetical protein